MSYDPIPEKDPPGRSNARLEGKRSGKMLATTTDSRSRPLRTSRYSGCTHLDLEHHIAPALQHRGAF